mmetsp:Transcript_77350/g.199098  ORF Transcript_77350/g.199098 Transcript_77350/m.199098 type:complete len:237 (-) Transcript_77350:290-1000(-)
MAPLPQQLTSSCAGWEPRHVCGTADTSQWVLPAMTHVGVIRGRLGRHLSLFSSPYSVATCDANPSLGLTGTGRSTATSKSSTRALRQRETCGLGSSSGWPLAPGVTGVQQPSSTLLGTSDDSLTDNATIDLRPELVKSSFGRPRFGASTDSAVQALSAAGLGRCWLPRGAVAACSRMSSCTDASKLCRSSRRDSGLLGPSSLPLICRSRWRTPARLAALSAISLLRESRLWLMSRT